MQGLRDALEHRSNELKASTSSRSDSQRQPGSLRESSDLNPSNPSSRQEPSVTLAPSLGGHEPSVTLAPSIGGNMSESFEGQPGIMPEAEEQTSPKKET